MKIKTVIIVLIAVAISTSAMALTPSKYRKVTKDASGMDVGNCIFTTNEPAKGAEDSYNVQSEFKCGNFKEIYARCYYAKTKKELANGDKLTRWYAFLKPTESTAQGVTHYPKSDLNLTDEDQNMMKLYPVDEANPEFAGKGSNKSYNSKVLIDGFCSGNKSVTLRLKMYYDTERETGRGDFAIGDFTVIPGKGSAASAGGSDSGKKGGGLKKLFGK